MGASARGRRKSWGYNLREEQHLKHGKLALLCGALCLSFGAAASASLYQKSNHQEVEAADSATLTSYYGSSFDWTAKGETLKTALFNKISSGTTVIGYSGLWTAYKTTDLDSDGKIWDIYSNYHYTPGTGQCGTYSVEGDCYNREHLIPQSVFSKSSPMVCDIHHIYPTDGKVNGMRSNYPHGYVASATYTSGNGSKLGTGDSTYGYTSTVFEPIDAYKGDVARAYFYFVTRYQGNISGYSYDSFAQNSYPSLATWAIKTYLKWAYDDPVSEKEINRNDRASTIQGNRNPYVDHPEAAARVWDPENTYGFFNTYGSASTVPTISVPSALSIDVGATGSAQASLSNMTGTVSYSSSATGVATVDSSGTVTGVSAGEATITASITYEGTTYTDTCTVTVSAVVPKITVGQSTLALTVGGSAGEVSFATANFDGTVSVTAVSGTPSTATVATNASSVTITPVAEGTSAVTLTASCGSQTAAATINVTVSAAVSSVTLSPASDGMPTGGYAAGTGSFTIASYSWTLSNFYATAATASGKLQVKASGYILNSAAFPNSVSSIVVTTTSTGSAPTITYGSTSSLGSTATSDSGSPCTYTLGSGATFIKILNGSSYSQWSSIQINFSTAAPKTLSSIAVATNPTKTSYTVGDTLDTTGIKVNGAYSDGSTADVTSSCTYSPTALSTVGTTTITVTCGSATTTFTVTVAAAATLQSIAVTTNPTKTSYYVGDAFDSTGLVVTGSYDNGSTSSISSGYTLSTPDMSSAGTKTITVTYQTFADTFDISVVAATATGIAVGTNPTTTSYSVGGTFDPTGLVINLVYDSGSTEATTSYSLSSPDMSTAGTKTITVTYTPNTSFTTTLDITVSDVPSAYTLVTDASSLVLGSNVIIAVAASDSKLAMSTTQDSSDRDDVAGITKDTNAGTATVTSASVCEFVLMKGLNDSSYSFYDPSANNGFIAASGSDTKTCLTEGALSAESTWSISVTSAGVATIKASSGTANILSYNSSSTFFRAYSSVQSGIAIYQRAATSSTIASEAKGWSRSYYATLTSLCTSTQQAASTPSSDLVAAWTTESGLFSSLTSSAENTLKGTTSSDSDVVAAKALYSFILNKYGTTSLSNFLAMTLSSNNSKSVEDGSDGEWAALTVALIASLALAGAVTIRKRKRPA